MATKYERLAEKKQRDDMRRRIKFNVQRWFSEKWQLLPAETKSLILTEWEKKPGQRATPIERDILEQSRRDYDAVLAQFPGAAQRFETPTLNRDFFLNASQEVLDRLIAEEMAKAGRTYDVEAAGRRTAGGITPGTDTYVSPRRNFAPGEREEVEADRNRFRKQLDLALMNAQVEIREREFEAQAKKYEKSRQDLFDRMGGRVSEAEVELRIGKAPNPITVIAERQRLQQLAREAGLEVPAPGAIAKLTTLVAVTDAALRRGYYGGFKSKGNRPTRGDGSATIAAERAGQLSEYIGNAVIAYREEHPDASTRDLKEVARRARLEFEARGGKRMETAGGRVARAASFAQKGERELFEKAKHLARMRIGEETWSTMDDEARQAAAEPFVSGFERVHRGERGMRTRKLAQPRIERRIKSIQRDPSGKLITEYEEQLVDVEEVWGTPADVDTLRKMFGARPTLWIYSDFGGRVKGEGGKRGAKVPNRTFADERGRPKPNPAYVAAKAEGKSEEELATIPKTLIAMAQARWDRDRAYLTETPSRVVYDAAGNPTLQRDVGAFAVLKDGKWVPASADEIKKLNRTLYDRTARERFYRKSAAIDPTLRIVNEAKRRIRDELDALGLPKGTKEQKRAYDAKVDSLVPLMVGSILANNLPRNAEEAEMAAFLTRALKTGEILVPASTAKEVEKVGRLRGAKAFERVIKEGPLQVKAIDIVDARYQDLATKIAKQTGTPREDVLKRLRENEEADVQAEYLSLLRGERGTREGLLIRKKEKPETPTNGLGLLSGWQDDIGGTITGLAVGGLIIYALYKGITGGKK